MSSLKPFIFNSTPLIYLAKADLLPKVKKLGTRNIIPQGVYKEVVVEGKKIGVKDAFLIEKLVERNVFKVQTLKNKKFQKHVQENPNIHSADAEVLALAKELNGIAVMDDEVCRNMAKVEGIEFVGSLYLLIEMFKNGILSSKEAREGLDKMIFSGWWCSLILYSRALKIFNR